MPPPRPPAAAPSARRAWIALGANLGDPEVALLRALRWLGAVPGVELEAASSLHRTAPVGPPQPSYVNAVARVRTRLAPRPLLRVLQRLERAAGRRREVTWGPRTLDLDLLMVGDLRLDDRDLTLPHPRMAGRTFVLAPLCELDPDLLHPALDRPMRDLLQALAP